MEGKSITLLLGVSGGNSMFGPNLALLTITSERLDEFERLWGLHDALREGIGERESIGGGALEALVLRDWLTTYIFDEELAERLELGDEGAWVILTPEQLASIDAERELHEEYTARTDVDRLYVFGNDLDFRAYTKHGDESLVTAAIKRDEIAELRAVLA